MLSHLVITILIPFSYSFIPKTIYGPTCIENECVYDCNTKNCSNTKIICEDTAHACIINCAENTCIGLYIYSAASETIVNCIGTNSCHKQLNTIESNNLHLFCGEFGIDTQLYQNNKKFNEPINSCIINCQGYKSCKNAYIHGKGNIGTLNVNTIGNDMDSFYDGNLICELNNNNECLLTCNHGNCNVDAQFQCLSGKCSCIGSQDCVSINTINTNQVNTTSNTLSHSNLIIISIVSMLFVCILAIVGVIVGKRLLNEHKSMENELKSLRNSHTGTSLYSSTPQTHTKTQSRTHTNTNTNSKEKRYLINITTPTNKTIPHNYGSNNIQIISPLSTVSNNNPFKKNTRHKKKHKNKNNNLNNNEIEKSIISDFSNVTGNSSSLQSQSNNSHSHSSTSMSSSNSSSCTSNSSSASSNSSSASSCSSSGSSINSGDTQSITTDENLEEEKDNIGSNNNNGSSHNGSSKKQEGAGIETLPDVWEVEDFQNIGSFDVVNKTMNEQAKEFLKIQHEQYINLEKNGLLNENNKNNNNNNNNNNNKLKIIDDNATVITSSTQSSSTSSTSNSRSNSINSSSTNSRSGSSSTSSASSSMTNNNNNESSTSSASQSIDEQIQLNNTKNDNNNNDNNKNNNNNEHDIDELDHMASVSDIDRNERVNSNKL